MSIKLMSTVWEKDLPQPEKFILLCLADHADDSGRKVFPSLALVAYKTGYERRQVRRIIKRLRERKILEVVAEAKRYSPTEYRIHIAAAPDQISFEEFRRNFETPAGDASGEIQRGRNVPPAKAMKTA